MGGRARGSGRHSLGGIRGGIVGQDHLKAGVIGQIGEGLPRGSGTSGAAAADRPAGCGALAQGAGGSSLASWGASTRRSSRVNSFMRTTAKRAETTHRSANACSRPCRFLSVGHTRSIVGLAAVGDPHHKHQQPVILQLTDHPVVAHPVAPQARPVGGQTLASLSWVAAGGHQIL